MGQSGDAAIWLNDPRRPAMKLRPLLRKTWFSVEDAIAQLIEYDTQDSHEKGVLINWQQPTEFKIDENLTEVYKSIISDMDQIAKRLNPKLSIILLGS